MTRTNQILIAMAALAMSALPAMAQDTSDISPNVLEMQAKQAASTGDWHAVVILAGASYRRQPTLENEFNLATAYANVGQVALAIPLFEQVARDGLYTRAQFLYDYRHGATVQDAGFNYADEANRRISLLTNVAMVHDYR